MTDTSGDAAGRDVRPRWARVTRVVYLGVLAGLLVWLVWTNRGDLADLVATVRPAWLLLALLLALGQLLPSVALWTLALRDLGHVVPVRSVLLATARSVPTRYLPGSVWYALGRAALLRQSQGVAGRSLAAVAALESALGFVVAIALGTAALAVVGRFPGEGAFLAGWFAVLAVLASPPVVNAGLRLWARRRGGHTPRLTWPGWGRLTAATVVHWAWSALTFSVYLAGFPGLRTGPALEVAGSFLVAWAVGFLAVFAPQGAGVFEVTVAALLVDSGTATVAIIAAGYRALVLVRDVLAFGMTALAGRTRR